MSKATSGTLTEEPCPHPGCPVPVRMVYHATRGGRLVIYHGEDEIARLEVDRQGGRNRGVTLADEIAAMSDDARAAMRLLGVGCAEQIAALHAAEEGQR